MLNAMVKQNLINSVINASNVEEHLFGNGNIINLPKKNIGSIFGLKKDIRFDSSAKSLGIANQNSNVLKIIG